MQTKLKVLCGRTIASSGRLCTNPARDNLGCFAHSENYREARKARGRKGGKLGGRNRASFSRELKGVRELIGTIITLLAYDELGPHIEGRMRDLHALLKAYTTLASYELRSAEIEDVGVPHSNTQPQLIDVGAIRDELENLVHRGEHPDDAA